MLNIHLLAVGSLKDRHLAACYNEYLKRLSPYARLQVRELSARPFGRHDRAQSLAEEGRRLEEAVRKIRQVEPQAKAYLLAERGRQFDSRQFARWLEKEGSVIFLLGGALGFSPEMYQNYPSISLSPLTFPHELARVILLEQLFRAAAISAGKEYHY